jgi:hypothetical protein
MKKLICMLVLFIELTCVAQSLNNQNFFFLRRTYFLSEFGNSPLGEFEAGRKMSYTYLAVFGYTLEPRWNLKNFRDKASVSLNIPFKARLLAEVQEVNLIGAFGGGAYLVYNKGFDATYNNIDKRGYSFGIGLDLEHWIFLTDEGKAWLKSPSLRFGYNSIINSYNNQNLKTVYKIGIPSRYEDESGVKQWSNMFFGLEFRIGF